ncbi:MULTISPECIES: DUF6660 family protein [Tenacibaculum]|uniref:Uncharacterized protein n=1 Tax=Tenacibaculum todarodis TaxID=1850252 RepID=A0A1L3JL77_9FLAO|nr:MULTISPECIES: DUF6660 family protein [Tenacibaculum]APG65916.1 hypothetical protein LPB136_11315 [Tenacibaculum todarodis]MCH3883689.1 hypothetical protein [Tenacibaculum aquimarinum]
MKYLAFILSIYILALNLAPCEDYAALDNEVQTEISQVTDSDHQHQDSDLCSPFCICQCCHISAIDFKFVDVNINISYISTKDFFYQNGTEKDFTTSILQPPRA